MPLPQTPAPAFKHTTWRHLLRQFTDAHRPLAAVNAAHLASYLAPVASIAWWLAGHASADLLVKPHVRLLVAGASAVEATDSGRWFSYLPWMLGRPDLRIDVVLVGNELVTNDHGPAPSAGLTKAQLDRKLESSHRAAVASRPECDIYNGTLGQWIKDAPGLDAVDACILFAPGFTSHYRSWLTEDDLLPVLRSRMPVAVFSYSELDALEDQHLLALAGVPLKACVPAVNPWHHTHEMKAQFGGFAQHFWPLETTHSDFTVDLDGADLQEFLELLDYGKEDYLQYGGDAAIMRLGLRLEVINADSGAQDAIIVLPYGHGILESTGDIGDFDEDGFSTWDADDLIDLDYLKTRPDDDLMARILWAIRTHRDVVEPITALADMDVQEDDDSVIAQLDSGDLNEGLRSLLKSVTGQDIDPDEFIEMMRATGGVHGPTHPSWYDLLASLDWKLLDYKDEPDRLAPAMWTKTPRRRLRLPLICEAYAFFPDDAEDKLAQEAMDHVAQRYPNGALLLFKAMPYTEVDGHRYHFGGMLWWRNEWKPFAFSAQIKSADDIIDQIDSGFSFDAVDPRYADNDSGVAVPFNRMCYGEDPNEPAGMYALSNRCWTTLMPAGAMESPLLAQPT